MKVLVVEDEGEFCRSVCSSLSKSGHEVLGVGTVREAVAALDGAPDLVLLDVSLADGPAEGLLDALDARGGRRPAVAVITGTCDGDRWLALQRRTEMMVPKPISLEAIRRVVAVMANRTESPFVGAFAARHRLSPRETRLLELAVEGVTNKEAAEVLGCSVGTIATYWQRIFAKTEQRSQRDVVAAILRESGGER